MKMLFSATLAALVATAAAKDGRSFAVLRFHGDGPLTEGRSDPIVNPGAMSPHVHTIMGGNAFSNSATGESMMKSTCSNANVAGDNSAYWMPKLYFHDQKNGSFEPVPLFYMNVYYFFEGTNDKIEAFPVGLQMVSGNAQQRTAPTTGDNILDPAKGTIQPAQFTCPRDKASEAISLYPAGSDGSTAGIGDKNNKGAGAGLPFAECNGYASPLRADLHFPSCYDPSKSLTDFKNNMAFPTSTGNNKQDCPKGWKHVPHLFYEMYWNTPLFKDRWTPYQGYQPFVLSNGDAAGYSLHGDFLAAWDTTVLQHVIDTCDEGDRGMDKCAGVTVTSDKEKCNIANPAPESIGGNLAALPGNNPLFGFKYGAGTPPPAASPSASQPSQQPPAESPSAPAEAPAPPAESPKPSAEAPAPSASFPAETPVGYVETTAAPAPAVTVVPEVITTTDSAGKVQVTTIWETVTKYATKTVYEDGPEPTPSAAPPNSNSSSADIAGWKHAGCYKDSSERAIHGEKFPKLGPMSNEKCVKYCQSKSFTVSGTENSGQCFCGNGLQFSEKLDASSCDKKCEGDDKDMCGGGWALTVYTKDGSVQADHKRNLHAHILRHRANRAYH